MLSVRTKTRRAELESKHECSILRKRNELTRGVFTPIILEIHQQQQMNSKIEVSKRLRQAGLLKRIGLSATVAQTRKCGGSGGSGAHKIIPRLWRRIRCSKKRPKETHGNVWCGGSLPLLCLPPWELGGEGQDGGWRERGKETR